MDKTRMDESREKLVRAFFFSLGSYMEQEAKKQDSWRDQSIGELYAHLSHEMQEIRRNLTKNELSYLLHNASDAVALATILLATVMEMAGVEEPESNR